MATSSATRDQSVLADLGVALRQHYGERLSKILLFGSRALGHAADDSDFDVLVVLNGSVVPSRERRAIGDIVYRLCWEHDAVLSCHFISADRYAREQSPFLLNVRREGVAVPA